MTKPEFFDLHEIVCPHVFYKYGDTAWQFFDPRHLANIDWLRRMTGPMFVNNWYDQYQDSEYIREIKKQIEATGLFDPATIPPSPFGLKDERGIRCNMCDMMRAKTASLEIYMSPHPMGQATDSDSRGKVAEEIRQYLLKNQDKAPFAFRIEAGKS